MLTKEGVSLAIEMVCRGPYRNVDLSNIFSLPSLYINNDRSLMTNEKTNVYASE